MDNRSVCADCGMVYGEDWCPGECDCKNNKLMDIIDKWKDYPMSVLADEISRYVQSALETQRNEILRGMPKENKDLDWEMGDMQYNHQEEGRNKGIRDCIASVKGEK